VRDGRQSGGTFLKNGLYVLDNLSKLIIMIAKTHQKVEKKRLWKVWIFVDLTFDSGKIIELTGSQPISISL